MTPLTMAGLSAIGSIFSGIGSAYAQSVSYDIQKIQARTAAKIAKMQGEADSLAMHRQLNKTLASNTVMAAAQGRSGGSVEGIASAATQQYNWDADFDKLSAEIEQGGYESQAAQYGAAASTALIGGSLSAISGGMMDYSESLYKIGDR